MASQLTVHLSEDIDARLRSKARKLGLKRSDIIRIALQQFLEDAIEKEIRPYEKVKKLIGSIETGIPDLGERHREYLIQRIRKGA